MTNGKKSMKTSANVSDAQRHDWQERQFIAAAVQYYVAARGAALAGLMPVSGHLVHHAIEMLAKAGIIKHNLSVPFAQTQRTLMSLRHDLKRVWEQFQSCCPSARLSAFDSLIAYLDRWEDIRYPDPDRLIGNAGMAMSIGRRKGQQPSAQMPSGQVAEYFLNLEECDELVKEMWLALGFSPAYFRHFLHVTKHASDVYSEDNLHPIV
jgi:hypothetical protein